MLNNIRIRKFAGVRKGSHPYQKAGKQIAKTKWVGLDKGSKRKMELHT
jgi:hypothetical protein